MTKRKRLTANQREALFEAHNGTCWRCGHPINRIHEQWHVGHKIDLACGGTDDLENLAPEHRSCNLEYAATHGNKMAAKIKRVRHRALGNREPKMRWSRKFDGTRRRWTKEKGWHDA